MISGGGLCFSRTGLGGAFREHLLEDISLRSWKRGLNKFFYRGQRSGGAGTAGDVFLMY